MTVLADAIERQLERQPLSVPGLSEELGRSAAVVRNTLATMYFHDKTIACDANGKYSLRRLPNPNGVPRIGYIGEREGDGFV